MPATLSSYFSQQLRWRRSNTIDYAGGFTHVWRLNPIIAIHYFSLFALQFAYPLAIIRALASHKFFEALEIHIGVMAVFGVYYRWKVRKLPKAERVGAFDFLPLAVLMPVAYALLAPLALFTLDSGSWETRGHEAPEAVPGEAISELSAPVRARRCRTIPRGSLDRATSSTTCCVGPIFGVGLQRHGSVSQAEPGILGGRTARRSSASTRWPACSR